MSMIDDVVNSTTLCEIIKQNMLMQILNQQDQSTFVVDSLGMLLTDVDLLNKGDMKGAYGL